MESEVNLGDESNFEAFGRVFSGRVSGWKEDLETLASEGAIYADLSLEEEHGGRGLYRACLTRSEIHQYVRAIVGWDQFLDGGWDSVEDRTLATDARRSAASRVEYDAGVQSGSVCPADFLGEQVESLACGWRVDRLERVRPDLGSRDAVALLNEIANSLPTSLRKLSQSSNGSSAWNIDSERAFQDVLFLVLRSISADVRREEWIPSAAGNSKRADLVIPEAKVLIEAKFVRNAGHARKIADELRVDIESYHSHPSCGVLFALIWDAKGFIGDPLQLEQGLAGRRVKSGRSFDVVARVLR